MQDRIRLKKGEQDRLLRGNLWVYDNEIERVEGSPDPGGIVDVLDCRGKFVGRGYYNAKSKITVRILTRQDEAVDEFFFRTRIQTAYAMRKGLGDLNSFRVVFGEADLLPALIVDKFNDVLCVQTLALGMDVRKDMIVRILRDVLAPKGIYERNGVPVREKEGLAQHKGFVGQPFDTDVIIRENEARMRVDVANGQKTGYFLDQRENRAALKSYIRGGRVLDCFCHTGGFAVHAGLYGAKDILAVDISDAALKQAAGNAALNGLNIGTRQANVFDLLKQFQKKKERFDLIVLDPPAFCKNRAALDNAYRGYKEINLRAMRLLESGGYLFTCSCSHYMYPEVFMRVLGDAAADSGRTARLIEFRTQSKDHPAPINSDESLYLKCVVLQVF